jgi:type VI secretion system protein ImpF
VGHIIHSLLDRLIDDDPEHAVEQAETDEAGLARYKLGLRRDLEGLLNSKRPLIAALRDDQDLASTVLAYGMTDISTEDFSAAGARDRIRRIVADCIQTHEPRLANVEVDMDGGPTSLGVRLRITAVLTLTRERETVVYDASVRPNDRAIAVELTG